eukprot:jgi/Mesvir1/8246/Mv12522-RA.2
MEATLLRGIQHAPHHAVASGPRPRFSKSVQPSRRSALVQKGLRSDFLGAQCASCLGVKSLAIGGPISQWTKPASKCVASGASHSSSVETSSLGQPGWRLDTVKRLYAREEAFDAVGMIDFFVDSPLHQYGNFEVALAHAGIHASLEGLLHHVAAVYHDVKQMWEADGIVFVELDLVYWRKDGSQVRLPAMNIVRFEGYKISELRVFLDSNPLFDPSIRHPASASVFTGPRGAKLHQPGTMLTHFATHPEAQEGLRTGFAPRWTYAGQGPKWPVAPGPGGHATPSDLEQPAVPPGTYTDMVKRLFSRGEASDSAGFIEFFNDTPVYQFGNGEVCLSKKEIFDSAVHVFSYLQAVYHEIKNIYEVGYTVFVEMDVAYWRPDGSTVTLPCADIFRVDPATGKFSELRIFMDANPVFNAALPVGDNASVFLLPGGGTEVPPLTMKRHFVDHPDGQQRVRDGYTPKWSVAAKGPRWPLPAPSGRSPMSSVPSTWTAGGPEAPAAAAATPQPPSTAARSPAAAAAASLVSQPNLVPSTFTGPPPGEPGWRTDMVRRLFSRGEAHDSAGFITFFVDKPLYQFGNFEVALTHDGIFGGAENFFSNINAVYHDIKQMWEVDGNVFVEMDVAYWRPDGSLVTLPCFDIFRFEGYKISELRIFMDCNPVFDASIPVPANSSVFTGPRGVRLPQPGTMLTHFATHPEAQRRVASGKAPRWSVADGGPKWRIRPARGLGANPTEPFPSVAPGTYTDMVKRLFSRGEASDSAGFIEFFNDTPVYQFGNGEVCLSKKEIFDSAVHVFSYLQAVYHEIKNIYEVGYTVFVEMDVAYWRPDGSTVTLPCADIFRVDPATGKFSELRIFMDANPVFNAALPVGKNSSVFLLADGSTAVPPSTMKRHFAEHPDGRQRVRDGYAPKWSVATKGPRWPLPATSTSTGGWSAAPSAPIAAASKTIVSQPNLTPSVFSGPPPGEPGWRTDMVRRLFSRGEAHDSAGFITFFVDKPLYQFGNFEVALTHDGIFGGAENFFSNINAVYHDIKQMWEVDGNVFVEMDVAYWRPDGSLVTLPCFDIFRFEGYKISELRIFMDCNPVFDASIPVPANSSVFTGARGVKLPQPGTMLTHFATHPEAQRRVASGKAPRWSVADGGPKWPIRPARGLGANPTEPFPSVAPGTYTDMVKRLFSRGEASDSAGFIEFFTDTPVYQFGNGEVCLSKQEIYDSAVHVFSYLQAVYHEIKNIYEVGYTVFVEMDVAYWRPDGSTVTLPCADIFRVDPATGKFSELRIFMDANPVFNAALPVGKNSSVFLLADGTTATPPETMKHHFARHPDAQSRVRNGYAPKWSVGAKGPKWPIPRA